jgi:hypothetical protein
MNMRIYIDIDGVLLANEENPALYAEKLIHYLADNHDVYWLTTHCRGDAIPTQQHLARHFPDQDTLRALGKFKPTNWEEWKTEGIDFGQPFLWLDDDLYPEEREELIKNSALDSFIQIDLSNDPEQLKEVIQFIRSQG